MSEFTFNTFSGVYDPIKRKYIVEKLDEKIHEYMKNRNTNSRLLILIDPFSYRALEMEMNKENTALKALHGIDNYKGHFIQCVECIDEFIQVQRLLPHEVYDDSLHLYEKQQKVYKELLNINGYNTEKCLTS